MVRYVLAVLVPPAAVCGAGCYTAPPIAVFWLAALSTLYLAPAWTAVWLGLAAFFWLAATTWAEVEAQWAEWEAHSFAWRDGQARSRRAYWAARRRAEAAMATVDAWADQW